MSKRDLLFGVIIGLLIGLLVLPIIFNLRVVSSLFARLGIILILAIGTPAGLWVAYLLGRRWPIVNQVAKFSVVGVLNTLLDVGILNFLSFMTGATSGTPIVVFNSISFSAAVVNSYFWNKYWTFAARDTAYGREFIQFLVVSALGLGINTVIVYSMTTLVASPLRVSPQLWENIAKAVAIPVSFVWNFFGYKFVVFRETAAKA